jgi:hypothetical protein
MTPDDAPEAWSERLQRGDPEATEEVFARYAEGLARLAGQNLSPRLAARLDSADVVQSAFRVRAEAPAGDEGIRAEAACEQPGPAEQAVLLDQIEALLGGLPP